jgi:L-fuconolactonase
MIRVDAHQHFWSVARTDYGWLTPALPRLYRDMLPAHLAPLLRRSGIDRTIAVQAAETEAETQFLLGLAEHNDFVAGVVGWTDLAAPEAPMRIERMARDARLVGLRPMLQDMPDDEWLMWDSVAPAIATMARANLRLDALVRPRHLPMLLRFAERNPDLPIVIDHAAKPEIRTGAIDAWSKDITRIADDTRAFCKLSGLATEAAAGWSADTLAPYVDVLLEAFGPRRLMWGSDWPVLLEAYDAAAANAETAYASWHEVAATLTARLSVADREWIFGGTAAAFYGLG